MPSIELFKGSSGLPVFLTAQTGLLWIFLPSKNYLNILGGKIIMLKWRREMHIWEVSRQIFLRWQNATSNFFDMAKCHVKKDWGGILPCQESLTWHFATSNFFDVTIPTTSKKLIMNFFDVLVIATSKTFDVTFLTELFTC